jgi:hypothetical protein
MTGKSGPEASKAKKPGRYISLKKCPDIPDHSSTKLNHWEFGLINQ